MSGEVAGHVRVKAQVQPYYHSPREAKYLATTFHEQADKPTLNRPRQDRPRSSSDARLFGCALDISPHGLPQRWVMGQAVGADGHVRRWVLDRFLWHTVVVISGKHTSLGSVRGWGSKCYLSNTAMGVGVRRHTLRCPTIQVGGGGPCSPESNCLAQIFLDTHRHTLVVAAMLDFRMI